MRTYNKIQSKASDSWLYQALDFVLYGMLEGGDTFQEASEWAFKKITEDWNDTGLTLEMITNEKELVLKAVEEFQSA